MKMSHFSKPVAIRFISMPAAGYSARILAVTHALKSKLERYEAAYRKARSSSMTQAEAAGFKIPQSLNKVYARTVVAGNAPSQKEVLII